MPFSIAKIITTTFGFFAAASGRLTNKWSNEPENKTLSGVYSINFNADLSRYGFPEKPTVTQDQAVIPNIAGADWRDFYNDEAIESEFYENDLPIDDSVMSTILSDLEAGFLLKMPQDSFLEFTLNSGQKFRIDPAKVKKTVLIEYVKKGKIEELNFIGASYDKSLNRINLERIDSFQTDRKLVMMAVSALVYSKGNDIPMSFELINRKSEIKEIKLNKSFDSFKEYGDYSLKDLQDKHPNSGEIKKVLSNLNELIKKLGAELVDSTAKKTLIDKLKDSAIQIADAEDTDGLKQAAANLNKIASSDFSKKLQVKFDDILEYAKTKLGNIVKNLMSIELDQQSSFRPK